MNGAAPGIEYSMDDIHGFRYVDGSASGIENITYPVSLELLDGAVRVSVGGGDTAWHRCRVSDMAGRVVVTAEFTGETIVRTDGYAQGVYVVSVDDNQQLLKFLVK